MGDCCPGCRRHRQAISTLSATPGSTSSVGQKPRVCLSWLLSTGVYLEEALQGWITLCAPLA